MKQRALPWKFEVQYVPGKQNQFADATSRNPTVSGDDDGDPPTITETLSGLRILDNYTDNQEEFAEVARS